MPKLLTLLHSKYGESILDGGESCGLQISLSRRLCSLREDKNPQKQVAKPRNVGFPMIL